MRVAAVDDRRGPRVGGPRLGLLRVGHRHHPQGEDLVDLGGVEQRARALLGHLRVVVQDDRRAEHHVGRPRAARPAPASSGAAGSGRPRRAAASGGSSSETNSAPSYASSSRCAPISEDRIASSLSADRGPACSLVTATVSRTKPSSGVGPACDPRGQRPPPAHDPADHGPSGLGERLDVLAAGHLDGDVRRRPAGAGTVDLPLDRLVPAQHQVVRPTVSSSTGDVGSRPVSSRCTCADLQLQEAQVDRATPRRRPGRAGTASPCRAPRRARRRRARRAEHAELPAGPGSSPSWPGTGRAGSPRRAPRRRSPRTGSRLMTTPSPCRGEQRARRSPPSVVRPCRAR